MQLSILFALIATASAAVRPVVSTFVVRTRPQASTVAPAAASPVAATTCASPLPTYGCLPLINQASWQNAMLSSHNTYRARHGSKALTWNSDLAAVALKNAQMNSDQNTFVHSTNTGYGENIGYMYGYNNPQYIIYLFYNEIQSYNYNSPGFSEATGHFTQVVWANTAQVGCAYVQNQKSGAANYGYYYLACEYSPPGNYAGQYQANVLPPNSNPYPAQPAQFL